MVGVRRLLITGGAGFIGANLVAHLCRYGGCDEITVLDDESAGRCSALAGLDVRFVRADVCDSDVLNDILPGHDAVVHLAAAGGVARSIADPEHVFRVNALGSHRLLDACRRAGVRRVIAASSGGALIGEAPAPVDETVLPQPLSPYGASKLVLEGYLSAFAGTYGLSTLALRFSNVFGPGSWHKDTVIACFCRQLLAGEQLVVFGDGCQMRDFIYIDDLVRGIVQALKSDALGVLQLGSGRPTSLGVLLSELSEVSGVRQLPVQYERARHGEVHTTWCDISRARAVIGFSPCTTLRTGLQQTWRWFQRTEAMPTGPSLDA